jgi:enolase
MRILDIRALQILDSRANPTLKVKVYLEDGSIGDFSVPSGASTGIHEAHELRDCNKNYFHGKSVLKAIENINKIKENLINRDLNQESLDNLLIDIDGSDNKEIIGANAILGISIAFAKACAKYYNLPLYEYLRRLNENVTFTNKTIENLNQIHLFANIINGGLHSGNELNIQEFMIVPIFGDINDKIRAISEIYNSLKDLIEEEYGKSNTAVGDEGGFAPNLFKTKDALDLITKAIDKNSYTGKVFIALDAAASDFFDKENSLYEVEKGLRLNYKELTNYYNKLLIEFPIISIEDPMAEDDFEGFAYFLQHSNRLKNNNVLNSKKEVLVVGDDLLVTNPNRIGIAIKSNLCNSLLLKINQIGTLSEALKAHHMSKKNAWHTIVSHRSGETTDSFISDLAVALKSSIKLGAPARGERVAKYNRLIEIYNES